jgi:hypothetical protein
MVLFLDKHSNYLNNKIKQKIICIPFVLTSHRRKEINVAVVVDDDDDLSHSLTHSH